MAITVGEYFTDGSSGMSAAAGNTSFALYNPAATSGYIDSVQVFHTGFSETNAKICAVYSAGGGTYAVRNYVTVFSIVGNGVLITGINLYFQAGDYIGIYIPGNSWLKNLNNGHSTYYGAGDCSGGTAFTPNTDYTGYGVALYGFSSGKKWNGITVGKWNGINPSKLNTI